MGIELTTDVASYVELSAGQRIRKWRWWFIVLVLLGILSAIYVIQQKVQESPRQGSLSFSQSSSSLDEADWFQRSIVLIADPPVDTTVAAARNGDSKDGVLPKDIQFLIVIGIFMTIALVMFVCLAAALLSSNPARVALASDIAKMCLGFFIGAATGYI